MAKKNEYILGIVNTSGGNGASVASDGSFVQGAATTDLDRKYINVTFKYLDIGF